MHTKKKKEIARVMIEEGATISEVAKQTQTPRGTIAYWSAKENLQQSQLEYLKTFREQMRERIRVNKLKRLSLNEEALYSIEEDINTGNIGKATFEKIKLSEEIEQMIFELDRIERLEKIKIELEIKKRELGEKDIEAQVKKDKVENELEIIKLKKKKIEKEVNENSKKFKLLE